MENGKIKLGDTVKVILSEGHTLQKGDIGIVTEIDESVGIRVTVEGKKNIANWTDEAFVELIKN